MKKQSKINRLALLLIGFVAAVFLAMSSAFAISSYDMVKFDEKGGYAGLSDEAKTLIKNSRKVLLERKKLFSKKFTIFFI